MMLIIDVFYCYSYIDVFIYKNLMDSTFNVFYGNLILRNESFWFDFIENWLRVEVVYKIDKLSKSLYFLS